MTMTIANLNALKSTVLSMKDSLEFMNVEAHKLNCLIDARDYLEDAIEELKSHGLNKGTPTAMPYMERVWNRLNLMKEYAMKDMQNESNTVDALIAAQCNAVVPMIDRVINESLGY